MQGQPRRRGGGGGGGGGLVRFGTLNEKYYDERYE